ncbi:hypothetical protein Tco_0922696 [Tanacetum coccineum]|uniref:Uncharacterized protein n=1 Tax=Tanacetum coccineum TaxID=301880 RepID=A0ABQ5D086_9ASTR
MSSSIVTYTSVYSDSEPWRFKWVSNEELEAPEEAPQPLEQAPPSPDYVPGPKHPSSPDCMPGPEHPPSPDYVSGPEYPKYLVADFDPKEDPKEDPANYPTDRGDEEEEESFGDDADDEDDEEASEDKDKEEEEHLALADSTILPVVDHVPSAEDTEAFETDESAPTPPSPRLRRARISV